MHPKFVPDTNFNVQPDSILKSPHSDDRPEGERISLLVIHNIELPPGE